jgi:glycolate oxidase
MNAELLDELRAALGADAVRVGSTELGLYGRDSSNIEGVAGAVCFPVSTAQVQAAVRAAVRHGVPFVARGSGTGLAGGATPLDGALVITLTKMNQVLSVDPIHRLAWVEPGVLNLDLTRLVAVHGLHFAPDPSSQQSCSIGGNLANNSGGPHCLADGVTSAHILAAEVVLPDGTIVVLGSGLYLWLRKGVQAASPSVHAADKSAGVFAGGALPASGAARSTEGAV